MAHLGGFKTTDNINDAWLKMTEGFSQTGLHTTHRFTTTSQHILLTGLAVNAT